MIKIIVLFFLAPLFAFADSPLTSTDFWKAYEADAVVKLASAPEKRQQPVVLKALLDPSRPIDLKVAIVNAHGFEATPYHLKDALAKKYGAAFAKRPESLSADDLLVYAYAEVMQDYFHSKRYLPLFALAEKKAPDSFTFAILHALAKSQEVMDQSWCSAWKFTHEVIQNGRPKMDMKPAAIAVIKEYMAGYESDCTQKK